MEKLSSREKDVLKKFITLFEMFEDYINKGNVLKGYYIFKNGNMYSFKIEKAGVKYSRNPYYKNKFVVVSVSTSTKTTIPYENLTYEFFLSLLFNKTFEKICVFMKNKNYIISQKEVLDAVNKTGFKGEDIKRKLSRDDCSY